MRQDNDDLGFFRGLFAAVPVGLVFWGLVLLGGCVVFS